VPVDGVWGTLCMCAPGFSKSPAQTCARCVAGKYKAALGDGACSDCAADSSSQDLNATSNQTCMPCPPTTTALAGSASCGCQSGYTGGNGTASCAACEPGKFKGSIGPASCTPCPEFSFSNTTAALSISVCRCIAGYEAGSTGTCTQCEPGKHNNASSDARCIACGTGTYSPSPGGTSSASCRPCPVHMHSPTGSGLLTDCVCNAGYSGPNATSPVCHACVQGTYKALTAAAACTACPEGSHSAVTGDTTGEACACKPAFSGAHAASCVLCAAGKYKSEAGSAPCSNCSAGTFSEEVGAASEHVCVGCPVQKITPGQQQRVSLLVHSRIRERRPRNRVRGLCQRQVQKRQRVGGMSGLPTSLVLECSCGHIELAVPV